MDWSRQFFLYCERAGDPAFWAEPFNAISNGAFLFSALAAAMHLMRLPLKPARALWALTGMTALVGIGSFLFHTTATRWALIADTSSIFLIAFSYLAFALRTFVTATATTTALALAGLLAGFALVRLLPCDPGLLPITAAAGHPCLNGSIGYLPVVAALALMAIILRIRAHPAALLVGSAALVFTLSLGLRTADLEVCAATQLLGRPRGTHALWHVLNAVALYLLLLAAIRHRAAHAAGRGLPLRP